MSSEKISTCIRLDPLLNKRLRIAAVNSGLSMSDMASKFILEGLTEVEANDKFYCIEKAKEYIP